MPPYADIYVAASGRNKACIDRFLLLYADLGADKLPEDFEVMLEGKGYVKTGNLYETIAYGLADGSRAFALYFTGIRLEIPHAMVYFTPDGNLVLGVSIDQGNCHEGIEGNLLSVLKSEFATSSGIIGYEMPPADAYESLRLSPQCP